MKIRYLGHATFLITTADGVRIITDPYEPGGYGGAIGYGPITEEADVVTISHEHGDHNYLAGVPGHPEIIRGPGWHLGKEVPIHGVAAHHDASGGQERGEVTIFVFDVDGVKVCHLGDLGHVLNHDQVRQIDAVDVLLLPVGGMATVDAATAAEVANQLGAPVIIPMHYKTEKLGFPFAPRDDFLRGKSNVKLLGHSEVEITRQSLPEAPEIWVLEPAL